MKDRKTKFYRNSYGAKEDQEKKVFFKAFKLKCLVRKFLLNLVAPPPQELFLQ